MDKKHIMQRIDRAFAYLDRVIPQPGASVDNLADGRRELRVLYAELTRPEPEAKETKEAEVGADG